MSKTVTVQARVEPDLKHKADAIIKKLGLNASQVVNALYAQIVMKKAIPFELRIPNKLTRETIEKSRRGEELKSFSSIDELMEDLNN